MLATNPVEFFGLIRIIYKLIFGATSSLQNQAYNPILVPPIVSNGNGQNIPRVLDFAIQRLFLHIKQWYIRSNLFRLDHLFLQLHPPVFPLVEVQRYLI